MNAAEQIVKRCGCGRSYILAEWQRLRLVGMQEGDGAGREGGRRMILPALDPTTGSGYIAGR